ncbi:MAG TPA: dienelactone hydrolase family protein [Acidimicrobiales bacterium]
MAVALDGFELTSFTYDGETRDVYRSGEGPGVVVIHEMPGLTPNVAAFGRRARDAGFTVAMPSLFGVPGKPMSPLYGVRQLAWGCVSREFHALALQRTSPITVWCRALARHLHRELGGPGVGAIGMCFTGGFALAMMVDEHTVAPVVSQPSLPLPIGAGRAADLNLSPEDLDAVVARARSGCEVMGLRFTGDRLVGTRFATLQRLLGDRFIAVEFPSVKRTDHSVLTEHVQEEGVQRVLAFLEAKLRP